MKKGCSSLDEEGGDRDVAVRSTASVSVDRHDRLWYPRIHEEINQPHPLERAAFFSTYNRSEERPLGANEPPFVAIL